MGEKINKYLSTPVFKGEEDITGYDIVRAAILVVALIFASTLG